MKARIFHVCQNFHPVLGGIESFVYESSKELIKKGYDVTVVTGDRMPNSGANTGKKLPASERIGGIKVFRFPFKRFSRYSTSVEALKFILSSDFDILHIHGIGFFSDAIPLVKFRTDKKIVLSTHGGIFHTQAMMPIKRIYFNTMVKIAGRYSDRVIAVSGQDQKFMRGIADRGKIVRIGNGIYHKEFSRIKNRGDGRTLLFIGRIAKNKRVDRAVRVLSRIIQSIPKARLVVVGEDWGEKRNLLRLAGGLKVGRSVVFAGTVSNKELKRRLSQSDVFLFPSEYEGFGISAVVAMAAGLPVVANDIDTARELITNGRDGFLVDFDNYDKASSVIEKLLLNRNLRRKIGKSARISSKKYDWSNIARKLDAMYKELLR